MAGTTFPNLRLPILLLLLCVSCSFLCLNAVPISRLASLQHNFQVSQDQMINMASVESFSRGRMDLDLNDYPGSGANNRHTPMGHN